MLQCRVCGKNFADREKLRVHLRRHDLNLTKHDVLPEYQDPKDDPLFGTTDEIMKAVVNDVGSVKNPPSPSTRRPRRGAPITEHDFFIRSLPVSVQILYDLGHSLEELKWQPRDLPQFRVNGKRFIPSVYNTRQKHAFIFRSQRESTSDVGDLKLALSQEGNKLTCFVIDHFGHIVQEI